jgi:hypothetical protein
MIMSEQKKPSGWKQRPTSFSTALKANKIGLGSISDGFAKVDFAQSR